MSDPAFRRRVRRLVAVKIQEIKDGCLVCQGKMPGPDGSDICREHDNLIGDMIEHPSKYAEELKRPGYSSDRG